MSHYATLATLVGMSHPALENKENPLYVKAMLLHVYMKPILEEIKQNRHYSLHDQLSRSVRSVKNCVNEAQSSESRADFVHKMKIADKELHESAGMIATEANASATLVKYRDLIMDLLTDVSKLMGKSIATARKNSK